MQEVDIGVLCIRLTIYFLCIFFNTNTCSQGWASGVLLKPTMYVVCCVSCVGLLRYCFLVSVLYTTFFLVVWVCYHTGRLLLVLSREKTKLISGKGNIIFCSLLFSLPCMYSQPY